MKTYISKAQAVLADELPNPSVAAPWLIWIQVRMSDDGSYHSFVSREQFTEDQAKALASRFREIA
jgi:hypothetical protein